MRITALLGVSILLLCAACSCPCHRHEVVVAAPALQAPAPVAEARAAEPRPSGSWSAETPVGRIVAERPETARIFERAGIDYCCGGAVPLGKAVNEKGEQADLEKLLAELSAVHATPPSAVQRSWVDASLRDLIDHIQATHHAYLREELPRLTALVEKVRRIHGANHPELAEVAEKYATLAKDLPAHLELEERRLFPAIASLEAGRAVASTDVLPALGTMEKDHDGAGEALHRIRELTGGYRPPADACESYRQMLAGLAGLESDLHTHVHLENNVLAPRVRALAGD